MKLEPLDPKQCEQVRIWRNAEMEVWRTPFMLTWEMQEEFYQRCNDRNSPHRYWAIIDEEEKYNPETIAEMQARLIIKPLGFIGMGGITHIQWENSIGEITLIIDPEKRKDGLGEKAVELLLDQAFNYLNLKTVFGECYLCNPAFEFWGSMIKKYANIDNKDKNGWFLTNSAYLPNRKYWNGKYYHGYYFSIDKNDFNNCNKSRE